MGKITSRSTMPVNTISNTDIFLISKDNGDGTFTSYKVTGSQMKSNFKGLSNFTEGVNTSSPNNTVNVTFLSANTSSTNGDFVIKPKGTGAILAAIPDGSHVNGAKRGMGAVDLQLNRNWSSRVASGNYSFLVGSESTASGLGSVAMGIGNGATGANSVVIGNNSNASNGASVSLGTTSNATGANSISIGDTVSSTNQNSICIGAWASATGQYSTALGRNHISSGVGSAAFGYGANTYNRYGAMTHAGGSSSSQWTRMIYRGNTSDATLTSLNAQEYFNDSYNTFSLQNQSAFRFKGTIIGKKSNSIDVATWDIDGLIVRGANAGTTTLVTNTVTLISNLPGWGTPQLTADTINGSLKVQVQGAAATSIRWSVNIEAIEVIFA